MKSDPSEEEQSLIGDGSFKDADTISVNLREESFDFRTQLKNWMADKKEHVTLAFYLVAVILIGTGNRVSFKIMQYATINYGYFISQVTTFIFIPINFIVIGLLLVFTDKITPEMRTFPQYKFAVMGLLDALQGLLIVVGGLYVPGIMQNLLLQGCVPVTMLFSIFILRPRGCEKCRKAIKLLEENNVTFVEQSTLPQECDSTTCLFKLVINNKELGGLAELEVLHETGRLKDLASNFSNTDQQNVTRNRNILVLSSRRAWREHFRTYYTKFQYIGASIILAGLVISVWPALTGGDGGGPILWDVIFFLATIPTALSGVYKEIAFREVADMDVWWLNGWVVLYQFLIGLLYAPLAAIMSDVAISDIPENIWQGAQCVFAGTNFISNPDDDCSTDTDCGGDGDQCCDSCDGSISGVSEVPAIWGLILYMSFNLTYNILLVLVIKHGSAALMYVASTVVLPLGSLCFIIPAFLGDHATSFTAYNGAGLVVVLLGLIFYRFVGAKKKETPIVPEATGPINFYETNFISHQSTKPVIRPKNMIEIRKGYYNTLGLNEFPPGQRSINQSDDVFQ